jgi:hypothetical protein
MYARALFRWWRCWRRSASRWYYRRSEQRAVLEHMVPFLLLGWRRVSRLGGYGALRNVLGAERWCIATAAPDVEHMGWGVCSALCLATPFSSLCRRPASPRQWHWCRLMRGACFACYIWVCTARAISASWNVPPPLAAIATRYGLSWGDGGPAVSARAVHISPAIDNYITFFVLVFRRRVMVLLTSVSRHRTGSVLGLACRPYTERINERRVADVA